MKMKLQDWKVLKVEGSKTLYTMTEGTCQMSSTEMKKGQGHIRGVIEREVGNFGETKVGVKVGTHAKWVETFVEGDEVMEVLNDILFEVITENEIKFL
jgi:hypothetical protein